jgi:hypothetical protein
MAGTNFTAFWDIEPRSFVEVKRRFGAAYCFHHQDDRESNTEDLYLQTDYSQDTFLLRWLVFPIVLYMFISSVLYIIFCIFLFCTLQFLSIFSGVIFS